jgi:hypothetical protein
MALLLGLPESALVDESGVLSNRHHQPCSYITWGMTNWPVGGRSSETLSYPIDMIMMMIIIINPR